MAADTAKLPETMTSLRVTSLKELEELMSHAEVLKSATPHSF